MSQSRVATVKVLGVHMAVSYEVEPEDGIIITGVVHRGQELHIEGVDDLVDLVVAAVEDYEADRAALAELP